MASRRWSGILVRRGRIPLIVLISILTVVFAWFASRTRLELSNESMQAANPELQRFYSEFTRTFGSDEVILVSLTEPELLERQGLRRLGRLTERVAALDGVRRAVSLATVIEVVAGPFGATEQPLLPPLDDPGFSREAVEAAIERNPYLTGLLISRDRRTAGIALELEDRPGDDAFCARIIESLRELKRESREAGEEIHLTGIAIQKYDSTRFVQRDQRLLLPISILVLAIALALATRHVLGVVLPLLATGVALFWTVGIYSAMGYRVNIITSLLPPVILALSITTSLHLYQEWIALGPRLSDRRALAWGVLESMSIPISLTALTTALGLGSLVVSDIPAVQQFGAFCALGVLLSLLLNLTLLPALMSMLAPPPSRQRSGTSKLRAWLVWAGNLSARHPKAILLAAAVPSVLALVGIGAIRNNTDLVRFLEPDAELVRDTMFIDEHLTGANAVELVYERVDGAPLTRPEDLARLDTFMGRVSQLDGVTSLLGIPQIVAQVHRAENDLPQATLPTERSDLLAVWDLLEASDRQDDIRGLISPDLRRARVGVRIHAIGTHDALALMERIQEHARETLGGAYRITPTGSFWLVVSDSTRLVANQVRSFALALGMVFLAIGLVFRSVKQLLAAVAPNLLPILWTGGWMGWVGIDLSTATAMVASVVLGVAVDGSIHYLDRFRRFHRGEVAVTVRETTLRTGRVVTMASLVLAVGFWVGALGSFRPTIYFSLLTGGTILSALVCDLLVLPACLVLLRPAQRSPR